uniref:CSC1/OSCA1-like cytosolic domain-containing protein n=2 Tax=Tetraselmis sp. GSL018 TaxID=582737 RepID=A0A061RWW3_9CHLO|mmetsp:Transcript_9136/g.22001  ORF Transcript_9136/g.22001 Transcript_9136/m.22001 type:complete len:969 (+) Transcript_9136:314-3220(+)
MKMSPFELEHLGQPSREEAVRKRRKKLLRDPTGDLLNLTASPQAIGSASAGVGVYFTSLYMYCLLSLILGVLFIYPFYLNISADGWSLGYELVSRYVNGTSGSWDCRFTSSALRSSIIGMVPRSTVGSFCLKSPFTSALACPSRCVYDEAEAMARQPWWEDPGFGPLDTCAEREGLLPVRQPHRGTNASSLPGMCLQHLPFCAFASEYCSCCRLELEGGDQAGYPVAALVAMLAGQVLFVAWVLLLWKTQIYVAEAVNRDIVTLPDFSVWVKGLPDDCTDNRRVADFFRHYGEVAACTTTASVGEVLRSSRRIDSMRVDLAELRARAAVEQGQALGGPGGTGCCGGLLRGLYWFLLSGFGSASQAAERLERRIAKEEQRMAQQEEAVVSSPRNSVGEALVTMNYEAHKRNALLDHKRDHRWKAVPGGVMKMIAPNRHSVPMFDGQRIKLQPAPEPSDYIWENTSTKDRRRRQVLGWLIFLFALGVSATAQYFLAAEAERERTRRLLFYFEQELGREAEASGRLDGLPSRIFDTFSRNYVGWTYGLVVVVLNLVVSSVQTWTSSNIESWSTASGREGSSVVKISLFYIINSFVIPFLAAYIQFEEGAGLEEGRLRVEEDGRTLWYINGGVIVSMFWIQVFNTFLGDAIALLSPFTLLNSLAFSRYALTQEKLDRLMALPQASISLRYASAVKTIALGVLTAPVLPISPLISLVGLVISFWTDKVIFLRMAHVRERVSYNLTKAINRVLIVLPLAQLLLMRFVYFAGQPGMREVFIAGAVFWACFVVLPVRRVLKIKRVQWAEDGGTGNQSYEEMFGHRHTAATQDGPDDRRLPPALYAPAVPEKVCGERFIGFVESHFKDQPKEPLMPIRELMDNQLQSTGMAATEPPPREPADSAAAHAAAGPPQVPWAMQAILGSSHIPLPAASGLGAAPFHNPYAAVRHTDQNQPSPAAGARPSVGSGYDAPPPLV